MALQGRARCAPSSLVRDARLIALHEAGHVIVARALGLVVTRVTIEPVFDPHYEKWARGMTWIKATGDHARDFSPAMRARLRREAIFSLAGPAAERHAFGQVPRGEDGIDAQVAEWLLSRDTKARDLPRVLRAARATADQLVSKRWPAIERLAAALMLHRTLTAASLTRRDVTRNF